MNFEELGAKREDIPLAVEKFGLGENGRTGGFVKLSSKDVEAILTIAADYKRPQ